MLADVDIAARAPLASFRIHAPVTPMTAYCTIGNCRAKVVEAYFVTVSFEPHDGLEARAAQLLPAMFLARVDGKSPVEYVTQESDGQSALASAIPLIVKPTSSLRQIASRWFT